jgi:adenylate cyclase
LYGVLIVVLPVILIKLLGLLQPIELACYDFLFYLNPFEEIDRRIVLIEWDEKSIQTLKESTISDSTLTALLNKVLSQQPRVIGLDLYRDIPVASAKLNVDKNNQANKLLTNIFAQNSNIIGIGKVVKPFTIQAPNILIEKEQVAASDLPLSSDGRVRKSYIFPNVDNYGNATEIPYVGIAIGYKYLEQQEFTSSNISQKLVITSPERQFTIRPIKNTFFNLFSNDSGWNFLINWRKVKSEENATNFITVSVLDVLSDRTILNLFQDRAVIIGSSAASMLDTHQTPLDRWDKNHKWTLGIEIVAQVASSIISTGLDNRILLNPAPYWFEILLMFFSSFILSWIGEKNLFKLESYFNHKVTNINIALSSFGLLTILILLTFFSFKIGLWINTIPTIIIVLLSYFFNVSFYQFKKNKRDLNYLNFLLKNFNHSLSNVTSEISGNSESTMLLFTNIEQQLKQDSYEFGISESDFHFTEQGQTINLIYQHLDNNQIQAKRIRRYQSQTENLIKYLYTENNNQATSKVDFNEAVRNIVNNFRNENFYLYDYEIFIEENYDSSIGLQVVSLEALQIILENLIDNSYYAVNPKAKIVDSSTNPEFSPKITIVTTNLGKYLQIKVEDNGCGIPKSIHQEIFKPSVSYRNLKSTGNGLFLVSKIVKDYKGFISLESSENRGTKISVTLPVLR